MKHPHKLRTEFTNAVNELMLKRGIPEDITQIILGVRNYAANVIRSYALQMQSPKRSMRISIRWFTMNIGLQDPFVMRNRAWHWTEPNDKNITAIDELIIYTKWNIAGRPATPYRSPKNSNEQGRTETTFNHKRSVFSSIIYSSNPAVPTPYIHLTFIQ